MQGVFKSPDIALATVKGIGICRKCGHFHPFGELPAELFFPQAFHWDFKHRACALENPKNVAFVFLGANIPRGFDDRIYEHHGQGPWWLDLVPNADTKVTYAADAAVTMDLSALAASATWVAGRESTSVSNTTNKYLDYSISGSFISGTTPTAGEARLYAVRPIEDTPTWPDVFDGTDSAETATNTDILASMVRIWSGGNSTSSNITYPVQNAITLAQAFGICPDAFVLFFTHSQVAALKTDAGNTNSMYQQGAYLTTA